MEDLPAFQKLKAKALPKGGSQNKSPEGKFWRGFTDSNVTQEVRIGIIIIAEQLVMILVHVIQHPTDSSLCDVLGRICVECE